MSFYSSTYVSPHLYITWLLAKICPCSCFETQILSTVLLRMDTRPSSLVWPVGAASVAFVMSRFDWSSMAIRIPDILLPSEMSNRY